VKAVPFFFCNTRVLGFVFWVLVFRKGGREGGSERESFIKNFPLGLDLGSSVE
jgi:hypothetical protein